MNRQNVVNIDNKVSIVLVAVFILIFSKVHLVVCSNAGAVPEGIFDVEQSLTA